MQHYIAINFNPHHGEVHITNLGWCSNDEDAIDSAKSLGVEASDFAEKIKIFKSNDGCLVDIKSGVIHEPGSYIVMAED